MFAQFYLFIAFLRRQFKNDSGCRTNLGSSERDVSCIRMAYVRLGNLPTFVGPLVVGIGKFCYVLKTLHMNERINAFAQLYSFMADRSE